MTTADVSVAADLPASVDLLLDALGALRRDDGSWSGHLPSSAVSTATAIIALHTVDRDGSAPLITAGAAWLRQDQADDGCWGDMPKGPASLNATALAVAALALVDPAESADPIRRGQDAITGMGGAEAVADSDQCSLSLLCQCYLHEAGLSQTGIRTLPFELVLLPRRLRNKLSFTVPGLMSWGLMQAAIDRGGLLRRGLARWSRPAALRYLEDLHTHESSHPDRLGGAEESPLMASIICFGLGKAGAGEALVAAYRDYLRSTVRPEGAWPINRDLEITATNYIAHGMLEAGRDDEVTPALEWLRASQHRRTFTPTGAPPGGWGWSVPSGWPDTDDTAFTLITMGRLGIDKSDPAVSRGLDWLLTMQNSNGSWACFARDAKIGMDLPCTAMTAHALIALQTHGYTATDPRIAKTLRWFAEVQRPDGAFGNVWFRGLTAGTAAVLESLEALGVGDNVVGRRCREWLLVHQLPDGSWGDGESGSGTVEETAWAALGLMAGGEADESATRGIGWLLQHQRPDGRFDPAIVGIYFMGLTYHYDHLAEGQALAALARWRRSATTSA